MLLSLALFIVRSISRRLKPKPPNKYGEPIVALWGRDMQIIKGNTVWTINPQVCSDDFGLGHA